MRRSALSILFCAAIACRGGKSEPAPEPAKDNADIVLTAGALDAAGVTIGAPHRAARRTNVTASGMLEFVPHRVARVGPLIEGRVISIRVDPGQRVEPGSVLAT